MTMIQVAMLGKLTYSAMADAIFTHPLLAEGLNTLFAMFDASRTRASLAGRGLAVRGHASGINRWTCQTSRPARSPGNRFPYPLTGAVRSRTQRTPRLGAVRRR
jgi:hypothetical protein